jgi:uncharacterized protein involved in exopolysaccharide biosynthesis
MPIESIEITAQHYKNKKFRKAIFLIILSGAIGFCLGFLLGILR